MSICAIPAIDPENVDEKEKEYRESRGDDGLMHALAAFPQLSSKPGAPATLYLDFDGHPAHVWNDFGNAPETPPYDRDGDSTTLTQDEAEDIEEIWKRVAETYSMFDINVTTVAPASLETNVSIAIIVGGDGAWYGGGGVAYLGLWSTPASARWGFCFAKALTNGDPKFTSDCINHEAGHQFGLVHHSVWSGTTLISQFDEGNSLIAPIMGIAFNAQRGIWVNSLTEVAFDDFQDDIPKMLTLTNFDYRADDHGGTRETAAVLASNGQSVSGSGIIEQLADVDGFAFSSAAGAVNIEVSSYLPGGKLDVKAELQDENGSVLASSDPSNSLSATLAVNVVDGIYYVFVSSHAANPGDLGQYTISGALPGAGRGGPLPTATPTPTVTATATPTSTPRATATPTIVPTPAELVLTKPKRGALIGRTVRLSIFTSQIDRIVVTDKIGRTWQVTVAELVGALSNVRLSIKGKSASLTILGFLGDAEVARQSVTLRPGKRLR